MRVTKPLWGHYYKRTFDRRGVRWGHDTVQAQFVGELINRRKQYPTNLRDTFERLFILRQTADYTADFVSEIQAARSLRRARTFVNTVQETRGY